MTGPARAERVAGSRVVHVHGALWLCLLSTIPEPDVEVVQQASSTFASTHLKLLHQHRGGDAEQQGQKGDDADDDGGNA
jgi:hypothetical protein